MALFIDIYQEQCLTGALLDDCPQPRQLLDTCSEADFPEAGRLPTLRFQKNRSSVCH